MSKTSGSWAAYKPQLLDTRNSSVIWGGILVGRQVSTVQRAELEYLRSRGIESTPTRFKYSKDNQIHKLVLLPYKVGDSYEAGGSDPVVSDGLLHTTILHLQIDFMATRYGTDSKSLVNFRPSSLLTPSEQVRHPQSCYGSERAHLKPPEPPLSPSVPAGV
jgi:hypothetical protein